MNRCCMRYRTGRRSPSHLQLLGESQLLLEGAEGVLAAYFVSFFESEMRVRADEYAKRVRRRPLLRRHRACGNIIVLCTCGRKELRHPQDRFDAAKASYCRYANSWRPTGLI
eukprot:GHVU01230197.1.p4 GENE.GHVU01230197.1~~GHVU01230197.1.p4  ORF type:complete len:112 (-),score=4.32 GHVU01230197.1:507-842(-)